MTADAQLRSHLVDLLTKRQAHGTFEDAVEGLDPALRGVRPEALPYSVWEQVEHIRIAQHDILAFCRDPDYTQPAWPDDYWPDAPAPPSDAVWTESVRQVVGDREAMCDLVRNTAIDLHAEIPHGDGQTYLREAMLVADHTAYHVGQIVAIRRALGAWR
jgi:hypothetical protein